MKGRNDLNKKIENVDLKKTEIFFELVVDFLFFKSSFESIQINMKKQF